MSAGASARPAVFQLDGNVAPWTEEAVPLARAPRGSVGVSVYLRLRGEQALKGLVARVSDPASPDYGKFLTAAQCRPGHLAGRRSQHGRARRRDIPGQRGTSLALRES